MKIIRKQLTAGEIYPTSVRYDDATDTVQFSPDGGSTWVDSPQNDPRLVDHFPPPDTASPRCDAAARMSAQVQHQVNLLIAGVDTSLEATQIANDFFNSLIWVPLFGVLFTAMTDIAAAVITIGSTDLHTAFDAFDWDEFTCRVYCQVNAQGYMVNEQFAVLKAQILSEYTTTQANVLYGIVNVMGRGVMNDAAAVRSETGDCSECDLCGWCHEALLDETDDSLTVVSEVAYNPRAHWVFGLGWTYNYYAPPSNIGYCQISAPFGSAYITTVELWYDAAGVRKGLNKAYDHTAATINPSSEGADGGLYKYTYTVNDTVDGLWFSLDMGLNSGNQGRTLKRWRVRGEGDCPFADCECE